MARQMLRSRGIEVSAGFPADLSAFHGSSEEAVVAAALACEDEGTSRAACGAAPPGTADPVGESVLVDAARRPAGGPGRSRRSG